jgi:A/G-specific adenine glycosylase
MPSFAQFNKTIRSHYRVHGRHGLPWRKTRDPYAILVSEIMLQQTQVARVEGFYGRFLARYPDFKALANARIVDVLTAWQGLGYNRRALALKKAAETVIKEYGSALPDDRVALERLPGIGRGTSGSLMAFAFNKPEIFIETNIRRVFIRSFFSRARKAVTDGAIERCIKRTIDRKRPREWYWAVMDYGAAMRGEHGEGGKNLNPNKKSAYYRKQSVFKGSDREARGKILRYLLAREKEKKGERTRKIKRKEEREEEDVSANVIKKIAGISGGRLQNILSRLIEEGFIIRRGNYFSINR